MTEIHSLGIYIPYLGGNPEFRKSKRSQRILDLKDKKTIGFDYFKNDVINWIKENFPEISAIAAIPSSDAKNRPSGIQILAKSVANETNLFDASLILERFESTQKMATGGDRSYDHHQQSIRLDSEYSIEGHNLILLDDVTKTGNSMKACRDILQTENPKIIVMLALGSTQFPD